MPEHCMHLLFPRLSRQSLFPIWKSALPSLNKKRIFYVIHARCMCGAKWIREKLQFRSGLAVRRPAAVQLHNYEPASNPDRANPYQESVRNFTHVTVSIIFHCSTVSILNGREWSAHLNFKWKTGSSFIDNQIVQWKAAITRRAMLSNMENGEK